MTFADLAFDKPIYSLPAFIRAFAGVAAVGPSLARVYLQHTITPAFRERIWVALSAANDCRYCSFVHRGWAGRLGVPGSEIAALAQLDLSPLERQMRAATDYLLAWAGHDFTEPEAAIRQPFETAFPASQRDGLRATARLCTFNNLTGNTFDALLSRLRGIPANDSLAFDEAIIGAFFLAGAAAVIPGLVWAERENPLALMNHFKAFSQRFSNPSF